jgi:hypothetical protein
LGRTRRCPGITLKPWHEIGRSAREELRDARPGCMEACRLNRVAGGEGVNRSFLIQPKANGYLHGKLQDGSVKVFSALI